MNTKKQNQAKFALINAETGRYELNVAGSTFDCRIPFEREHVFVQIDPDVDDKPIIREGEERRYSFESSLIVVSFPFSETLETESDIDRRSTLLGLDPTNPFYAELSCVTRAGGARNFVCRERATPFQFRRSLFQGCNHAK